MVRAGGRYVELPMLSAGQGGTLTALCHPLCHPQLPPGRGKRVAHALLVLTEDKTGFVAGWAAKSSSQLLTLFMACLCSVATLLGCQEEAVSAQCCGNVK